MNAWGPALLSSGVVGAIIPLLIAVMNRRQTRSLAAEVDAKRDNTLADAAQKWQQMLDQSRMEAYLEVEKRCKKCERGLTSRDTAIDALIDAMTELIALVPAGAVETEAARAAIRTARRARHGSD